MIKAIIFDFGGVVAEEKAEDFWKQACKKVNINYPDSLPSFEKLVPYISTGKISNEKFWQMMLKDLVIDDDAKKYENVLYEAYAEITKIRPEMMDLVELLKNNGYVTALLSDTDENVARYNKEHKRYDYFSPVILSSEVGIAKPDRRMYELMLRELSIPPTECVYTDDRERNLIPAKELGMKTILFESSEKLKKGLKKLGIKF